MKKKTKIRLLITILTLLLIGVFIVFELLHLRTKNNKISSTDELTSAEENILIASKTYPTKILIYGDKIDFDPKLNVNYIKDINEKTLKFDNNYYYQLIIINDLKENVNLSYNEWKLINKHIRSDKRCNFIYLGSKEFNKIKSTRIVDNDTCFEDNALSVGLFYEEDILMTILGTCTKDMYSLYKDTIKEMILYEQVHSIKISNK